MIGHNAKLASYHLFDKPLPRSARKRADSPTRVLKRLTNEAKILRIESTGPNGTVRRGQICGRQGKCGDARRHFSAIPRESLWPNSRVGWCGASFPAIRPARRSLLRRLYHPPADNAWRIVQPVSGRNLLPQFFVEQDRAQERDR